MTTTARREVRAVTRTTPPSSFDTEPPALTQQETLVDLLTQSGRGTVPIRNTFVQQGRGKKTVPGPLASFISAHDARALDAYLFVHALASAPPWDCEYPSGTWIRAFGLTDTATVRSARGVVSKLMKRLEDRKLIERGRSGRTATVTLLKEDGSGDEYKRPISKHDPWFHLPHAYWLDEHYRKLSLPAKGLLLVAMSLPDDFYLPLDKADKWYGISGDSAGRGLRELESLGFLEYQRRWIKNQRSDTGWIEQRHYALTGPYSSAARRAAAGQRQAEDDAPTKTKKAKIKKKVKIKKTAKAKPKAGAA